MSAINRLRSTTKSLFLGIAACLLLSASSVNAGLEQGSVAKQFNLNVNGRDVSDCWLTCHMFTIDLLPAPWMQEPQNNPWQLQRNCEYDAYRESMGKCLIYECKSSWDVKYAVEYGSVICKKAGVKMEITIDPGYKATAGGYYATSTMSADSPVLSSSAQQALAFGRRTAGLAVAGVAAGMMVVLGEL